MRARDIEDLSASGGEGLPIDDDHELTWLFTCVECGNRWADPPGPVTGCSCGGHVVGHKFSKSEYDQLLMDGRLTETETGGKSDT